MVSKLIGVEFTAINLIKHTALELNAYANETHFCTIQNWWHYYLENVFDVQIKHAQSEGEKQK